MEVVRGDLGLPGGLADAWLSRGALGAAAARTQATGAEMISEKTALLPPGGRVQFKVSGAVQPFHSKSFPKKTWRVCSSRTTSSGVPWLRIFPLWMM